MKLKSRWRVTGRARSGHGYNHFGGSKKGVSWDMKVHRIVATLFIPNPDNLPEVDHKDGDRTNNHVGNLRWVSHQQNAENKSGRGTQKKGSRWTAHIKVNGRNVYLGMFDTEEEAHARYLVAKKLAHAFWTGR